MCPKMFVFSKFGTCTRNDSFRAFLVKHNQGTEGVKELNTLILLLFLFDKINIHKIANIQTINILN